MYMHAKRFLLPYSSQDMRGIASRFRYISTSSFELYRGDGQDIRRRFRCKTSTSFQYRNIAETKHSPHLKALSAPRCFNVEDQFIPENAKSYTCPRLLPQQAFTNPSITYLDLVNPSTRLWLFISLKGQLTHLEPAGLTREPLVLLTSNA